MTKNVKEFIEKNIELLEEKHYVLFFRRAQDEFIASTVGEISKIVRDVIEDPLPYMTFIPEAYFILDQMTTYDIPENIQEIGEKAFKLSDLESIRIPANVEELRESCFESCDSLESVVLENGVKYIGEGAFVSCDALSYVEIPKSMYWICDHAFYDCSSLRSITYKGTMQEWQKIGNIESAIKTSSKTISQIICSDGSITI